MKYLAFLLFMLTIPFANFLIGNFGTVCLENGPCLIPVGFGLMAPSGVLLVGLALVLRDWLQELTNWKWSALAVTFGAIVSWVLADPFIAIASAVAFFTAEMLDLAVYTPLRKSGRALAVFVSGLVGSVVDSVIFVYLAFGSLEFSAGNTLGKLYATVAVTLAIFVWSKYVTLSRNSNKSQI
jgi:uncharacterized PurR-regulated membrane protein YhhQ (DUF165 family)